MLDNVSNLTGQQMSHLKLRLIKPQFYLNLSMYLKRHGKFCFFTHLLTQLVGFPDESVGFDHFLSEHQGFSFKLNQILPAGKKITKKQSIRFSVPNHSNYLQLSERLMTPSGCHDD